MPRGRVIALAILTALTASAAALAQERETERRTAGEARSPGLAQVDAPAVSMPPIEVIGTTPLLGTGVEKDKVPVNVQSFDREELDEAAPLHLGDFLNRRAGSVVVNDAQNNPFQPNIQFRGFTASPLLGEPQGIAVFQNGVRINEPFGDVVQWDTIPEFAIDSVQLVPSSNPTYGLNALGGAIGIHMKNGFDNPGALAEAYGGSFGRWQATGEYGGSVEAGPGEFGFYAGVTGFDEDGWRDFSPSDLQQVYTDGRFRNDSTELGLNLTYVNSSLTGNGAIPEELLAIDRDAIYTYPDLTENELFSAALDGNHFLTDRISLQGTAYFRRLRRKTLNGDEAEFACEEEDEALSCTAAEEDEEDEEEEGEDVLEFNGALNSSETETTGVGASLQTTVEEKVFDLANHLVVGASVDYADIKFNQQAEVGELTAERGVDPLGVFAEGDEFNTRLEGQNRFIGLYFSDTLSLTDRLDLTLAGRWNHATIDVDDQLGTALTSDNTFSRFNPSVGLTYKLLDDVTAFASYAESNRAPSAAELGCSDPESPCRVPNAFVADPPLEDVVTRSVEAGFRGRAGFFGPDAPIGWSVTGFGSRNDDDIIFVSGSGPFVGSGYFTNAGTTQRVGVELGLDGRVGRFSWYANYTFLDATFQSDLRIASEGHPFADEDGTIQVEAGDRIPGIPQHIGKLGLGVRITDEWFVGLDGILNSDQFLRGDESNQLDTVSGYAVFNLNSTYRIARLGERGSFEAFLKINNIFDTEYETFGIVAESPSEVLGDDFTSPIFLGPGAPLGVWGGLRLTF